MSTLTTTTKLIHTGILMGIVHVLTGPDHLSALATLSASDILRNNEDNSENNNDDVIIISNHRRRCLRSFALGLRWGIGHSVGLLFVGGVLLSLQVETSSDDKDAFTTGLIEQPWLTVLLDALVGVFMLALGTHGVLKAWRNRRLYRSIISDMNEERIDQRGDNTLKMTTTADSSNKIYAPGHVDYKINIRQSRRAAPFNPTMNTEEEDLLELSDLHKRDPIVEQMEACLQRDSETAAAAAAVTFPITDEEDTPKDLSENFLYKNSNNHHLKHSSLPTRKKNNYRMNHPSRTDYNMSMVSIVLNNDVTSNISADTEEISDNNPIPFFINDHDSNTNTCIPTPLLALLAGIFHGVAGPGGVLGVLPAVQLHNRRLASCYLGTFCITSTLVMGFFAAFYGSLSHQVAGEWGGCFCCCSPNLGSRVNRVFWVEVSSSGLSLVVGIVWIILLALGRLEEIFP